MRGSRLMQLFRQLTRLALVLLAAPLSAQAGDAALIVFDASGSMTWNGANVPTPATCTGIGCRGKNLGSGRVNDTNGDSSRLAHGKRMAHDALAEYSTRKLSAGLLVFGPDGCANVTVAAPLIQG